MTRLVSTRQSNLTARQASTQRLDKVFRFGNTPYNPNSQTKPMLPKKNTETGYKLFAVTKQIFSKQKTT